MGMSTAAQNTGLAVLAAVAIGASAYAYWSVNGPPAPSSVSMPADGASQSRPVSPTTPVEDDEGATGDAGASSADAVASTGDAGAATSDAEETTAEPSSSSVASWARALDRADHLLVLADGRGNEESEWVQVWGTLLAADRPVTLRHWGEAQDRSFNPPTTLPEDGGEGRPLTIWSASRAASSIASVTELLPRIDSASADPDVLLVSLGAASAEEDVPDALDGLLAALPPGLAGVPVLVVVGPSGSGSEEDVDDAVATWAQEHADDVALVDLRESGAGDADPQGWAQALQEALGGDDR